MAQTPLEAAPVEPDVREHAEASARRAAEQAAVVVKPLESLSELDAGSRLIEQVWDDGEPKAPTSLLRALSHAGSFVGGAYSEGELVGVSFGFFELEDGELLLHSHITGVASAFQSRSVGFALKQFQRSWALERGIRTIQWTADPLVRGNVYFNLVKLGASLVAYHADFYGRLQDRLNAGEESDRVVVRWELTSERAMQAGDGKTAAAPSRDAGRVLLSERADGEPAIADVDGEPLLAWIPSDIVRMREEHPDRARAWRRAVRDTVGRSLSDGYRADNATRDGWLVLTR